MHEFLISYFSKKGLDKIASWLSDQFRPLIVKDGRFRLRRLIAPIVAIAFGFAIYHFLPKYLQPLAIAFDLYDPKSLPLTAWSGFIQRVATDSHYSRLVQDLFAATYIACAFALWSLMARKNYRRLEELYGESKNLITFAKSAKLRDGSRCSTDDERAIMNRDIAEKIASSQTTKVMLVNGYHDFTDIGSPIKTALDKKAGALKLKVLLLDPFSSYAKQRAKTLLQETSEHLSWMRYIRDYDKTRGQLDYLKNQRNGKIEHKVYCSKPFFRLYLFDQDLYIQSYYEHQHGYTAPMYHYEDGDGSMFKFGKEMFNYYWNRSFSFDKSFVEDQGRALTVYLAEMYGLLEPKDVPGKESLEGQIDNYVKKMFEKSKELDSQGKLTDFD